MRASLQNFKNQWDYLSSRFQGFLVTDPADVEGCVAVLEEVRRNELNRVSGGGVLDSGAFAGHETGYHLCAVRDRQRNRIVGCVRATLAFDLKNIDKTREEYRLELFDDAILKRTFIATRLAVLREYRKTIASLSLLMGAFEAALDHDYVLGLISCEPNLLSMYKRLGARPMGPVHNSPSGGFRVPMVVVMDDLEHLTACGSPLRRVARAARPGGEPGDGTRWYRGFVEKHGELDTGIAMYDGHDDAPFHHVLAQGLDGSARSLLFKNSMIVTCKENDVILAREDGGKNMALIRKGLVKIEVEGRTVALLGEGELIGELACILDSKRTADVVAAVPETEIVVLSLSAIERLPSDKDRSIVWRNLARCVAERLSLQTRRSVTG